MAFGNGKNLGNARLFRDLLGGLAVRLNEEPSDGEIERILDSNLLFLGRAGMPGAIYLDFVDGEYKIREWRGERIDPDSCPTQIIPSLDLAVVYTGVARGRLGKQLEGDRLNEAGFKGLPKDLLEYWRRSYSIKDLNELRRY